MADCLSCAHSTDGRRCSNDVTETARSYSIASLDHYSKGAVLEWGVSEMCGIKVSGENEFMIAPKVGGHFTFAKCEYQSVYGKVSCGWEREINKTVYTISVPANTSARIVLPDGERTVTAGEYEFTVQENGN